jgi:phosphate starvation-inducible protein PhoH
MGTNPGRGVCPAGCGKTIIAISTNSATAAAAENHLVITILLAAPECSL